MRKALSVNRLAWILLDSVIENADIYRVGVDKTDSGTTVIDTGINVSGGFEAGRIITEMCMGGCAKAKITSRGYGDIDLPSIEILSDHPVIATLGSQYAGWQISEEGYFAVGSGPARALARRPKRIYQEIGYEDDFEKGIVILEASKFPPQKLMQRFANDCGILAENLAVVLTPTTSVTGATQISGRIVETGIHKLRRIGLDISEIVYASGYAPISPVHPNFARAMGRTNDSILYGGVAYYVVEHENDENLKAIVKKAPSMASETYGRPFFHIFREAECDFYRIDPNLFAPAVLVINNAKTGTTFQCGKINDEALAESFNIERESRMN
jgi:methenyltetrahydromethanopterin cyclohydrolase